MAEKLTRERVAETADIHESLATRQPTRVDRGFELPTGLYVATAGLYFGFVALLGVAFANPKMILPVAVITLLVVAAFGLPSIWVKMNPDDGQRATPWSRFKAQGIMTLTGHCSAGAASVQVLILPVLIFVWGVAVVTIAALVR